MELLEVNYVSASIGKTRQIIVIKKFYKDQKNNDATSEVISETIFEGKLTRLSKWRIRLFNNDHSSFSNIIKYNLIESLDLLNNRAPTPPPPPLPPLWYLLKRELQPQ